MSRFNKIILTIGLVVFILVVGLLISSIFDNLMQNTYPNKIVIKIEKEIPPPSYEYLKSITVYITGQIPSKTLKDGTIRIGQSWTGTGSIVKIDEEYTYILTNAHVVGDKKRGVVLFVDNGLRKVESEIVAFHRNTDTIDLAVIKVKGKLKGKIPVKGFAISSPSDKLYLVGHHLGRQYIYGVGVMAGYDGIYDLIQIPTLYGNSGTAVCNSEGKLVSVVFAINRIGWFDVDVAHGLCINGLSVQLFLQRLGLLEGEKCQ